MKKKLRVCCLLLAVLLFTGIKEDTVRAAQVNPAVEPKAKSYSDSKSAKYFAVKTSGKGEKIVVTVPKFKKGDTAKVTLCNSRKQPISKSVKVAGASSKINFFVKGGSKYYIKADLSDRKLKVKAKGKILKTSSGNSFDSAVTIKPGSSRGDVIGYNTGKKEKQYFKIEVDKEKLVKLNLKKVESSGPSDRMDIKIFKSTDRKNPVEDGALYESQESGYIVIRNSENYKTEAGTYYIEVSKGAAKSGFQYRISYE